MKRAARLAAFTAVLACFGTQSLALEPAGRKARDELIQVSPDRTVVKALCGEAPLRSCAEFVAPIAQLLRKQVAQHVQALYQGKVLNPWSSGEADKFLSNVNIQKPICNLADKVGKPTPDSESRNHLAESCGATSCRVVCRQGQDGALDCGPDSASCLKERAWTRGALVQLAWGSFDDVVEELKNQRVLNVSGKCNAVLKSGPETQSMVKKLSDGIRQWSELNGDRPISCKPGTTNSSAEPGDVLGCELNAALTIYEKIVAQLGSCEIFSRAYQKFLLKKPSFEEAIENALLDAQPSCQGQAQNPEAYRSCLQAEYDRKIKGRFLEKMEGFENAPRHGGEAE